MSVQLPKYAKKLLQDKRYKVLYGGRGSAKSYTVARLLLLKASNQVRRVLCAREFQNSINDSVHHLLAQEIEKLNLGHFFNITNSSITGINGSEFIFKGVRHNAQSIKSISSLTDLWVEEAQTVSQSSWQVLIPTIREEGSEIYVTFNPDSENDPTYRMFVDPQGKPIERSDAVILKVNHNHNPWFPEVLRKEMNALYTNNPDLADHIWGGNIRSHSDAQIFKNKWAVQEFEKQEHWSGEYMGADWGFSQDPNTLVSCFIDPMSNTLFIRHARFGYGTELNDIPNMYDLVPNSRQKIIRADNSRPETISHIKGMGFKIQAAEKWAGSVEDGITFLKNFSKIIIHPECTKMIEEAKNYSYKTDKLTGDVLSDIIDTYNHGWDAVRYALQPMIKNAKTGKFTEDYADLKNSGFDSNKLHW